MRLIVGAMAVSGFSREGAYWTHGAAQTALEDAEP